DSEEGEAALEERSSRGSDQGGGGRGLSQGSEADHRLARRRGPQGAKEDGRIRAPWFRQVRRRQEARPPGARGDQPLHEGKAEVRGQAREQGRSRASGQGDQRR